MCQKKIYLCANGEPSVAGRSQYPAPPLHLHTPLKVNVAVSVGALDGNTKVIHHKTLT